MCARSYTSNRPPYAASLHTLKPLPSASSTLGATLATINSGRILAEFDAYVVSEMLRRLERRTNAQAGNRSTLKTDHILQKRSVFKEGLHLLRQQRLKKLRAGPPQQLFSPILFSLFPQVHGKPKISGVLSFQTTPFWCFKQPLR